MNGPVIERVEGARLSGRRPRAAGCNARLGPHGIDVCPFVVRLTDSDGASGFGRARVDEESSLRLLGRTLEEFIDPCGRVAGEWRPFEYPLLDLWGRRQGRPLHACCGSCAQGKATAPCYDTSLYIDDLGAENDEAAARLMAGEAEDGWERGHRAFKIKVGRGALHMNLNEGMRRDIAVVRAVREAVGPDAVIMLDANNGLNYNLTIQLLSAVADCQPYWMEEPFHEDARLLGLLRSWLVGRGCAVKLADGEGQASPHLLDWTARGRVDVVQYDIFGYGFTRWRELGGQLDGLRAGSAPHHYGGFFGNFYSAHLAPLIDRFEFVEWDEATVDGIDVSAYSIEEGQVTIPDAPGFGMELDDSLYRSAVTDNGFEVTA